MLSRTISTDIFSKAVDAKNRWLGYEEPETSSTPSPTPSPRYSTVVDWGPQQIGRQLSSDHVRVFKHHL